MSAAEEKKLRTGDYDDEDRKKLIDLMNEYSNKLAVMCSALERSHTSLNSWIFYYWLILILSWMGISFFFDYRFEYFRDFFNYSIADGPKSISPFLYTLLLFGITYVAFGITLFSGFLRKIDSILKDSKIIAKKLERVVELVSQMQEHSINRLSSRIEMDLRITDAEFALEHYEILRKKENSFFKLIRFFCELPHSFSAILNDIFFGLVEILFNLGSILAAFFRQK